MYVKIFKTDVIVFIGDVTLTNTFQYQSQFLRMRVMNWPNIFVDQCQFRDPDFISSTHQRENVQFHFIWKLGKIAKAINIFIKGFFSFCEVWFQSPLPIQMAIKCVKDTVVPLLPGTYFRCTEIIKCYYIYPSRVTIPLYCWKGGHIRGTTV
jgi:hypothetical protein